MLTLYDWGLETTCGSGAVVASGYVTDHPKAKLYNGCWIYTSMVQEASVAEGRLLLHTLSDHLYSLAPEAVGMDEWERTEACLRALGVDADFAEHCLRARTQAQAQRRSEKERTLEPGELLLEVVGVKIISAALRTPEGELREVELWGQGGMARDSILMLEHLEGTVDFRSSPTGNTLRPYRLAPWLKTVKVRNLGSTEVLFGTPGDQTPCPAGTLTVISVENSPVKRGPADADHP